jgi:hypothetical protein
MYLCDVALVYLMIYDGVEVIDRVNLNYICLIMNRELTPSGRLVDRLPYSYEWVDDVHD